MGSLPVVWLSVKMGFIEIIAGELAFRHTFEQPSKQQLDRPRQSLSVKHSCFLSEEHPVSVEIASRGQTILVPWRKQ